MKRLISPVVVLGLVVLAGSPAWAQMEIVLGKPLPISSMQPGTISVRVVRGSMSAPVAGVDVVLEGPDNSTKTARTGSRGRATFAGLTVGATYLARAVVDEKPLVTESFAIPTSGGLAFLLSPIPLAQMSPSTGGDHGGTGVGGDSLPPIMREPRRLSGRPRPEANDPPGQVTVRVVQGKFRQTEAGIESDFPPGVKVFVVGYHSDGAVSVEPRAVDDEGRVRFTGLVRSTTSYYAMAALRRDNGVVDRLVSRPVQLPPKSGVRVLLAGEARDSLAPAIDDQRPGSTPPVPAGRISVLLDATPDQQPALTGIKKVELVDAASGKIVAQAAVAAGRVRPEDVAGRGEAINNASWGLSPGQAGFMVIRMSNRQPQPGVTVEVREAGPSSDQPKQVSRAGSPTVEPGAGVAAVFSGQTNPNGLAVFAQLVPGKTYIATATVRGKTIASTPLTMEPGKPLSAAFIVDWPPESVRRAQFEVPPDSDTIYYARIHPGGRELVSPPIQLSEGEGSATSFFLAPPILFGFHGGGEVDDARFWFEMRLSVYNTGNRPFDPGEDGLLIPLPADFVGATVEENMSTSVKVVKGEGLRFIRAIPPGQENFNISFALPVDDGEVSFSMPLPYGLSQSSLMLGNSPGAKLSGIPASITPELKELNGKKFLRYAPLNIGPQQSLKFQMAGLPQPPRWHSWLRILVGVVLIVCIVWVGMGLATRRDGGQPASAHLRLLEKKRERLLDELVRLEGRWGNKQVSAEAYERDRDKQVKQLEQIWDELGGRVA